MILRTHGEGRAQAQRWKCTIVRAKWFIHGKENPKLCGPQQWTPTRAFTSPPAWQEVLLALSVALVLAPWSTVLPALAQCPLPSVQAPLSWTLTSLGFRAVI